MLGGRDGMHLKGVPTCCPVKAGQLVLARARAMFGHGAQRAGARVASEMGSGL